MTRSLSLCLSGSKARLPDLIEAFTADVSDIVALFAAKRQTAGEVAAEPAAQDARAPLTSCCFKSSSRLSFFVAVWALDVLRCSLLVYSGHSFVLFKFFGSQELRKFFLARVLTGSIFGVRCRPSYSCC